MLVVYSRPCSEQQLFALNNTRCTDRPTGRAPQLRELGHPHPLPPQPGKEFNMETLNIIAQTIVDVLAHLVSPLANLGEFLGGFVELSEAGSSASSAADTTPAVDA